jgi:hypothetical protein
MISCSYRASHEYLEIAIAVSVSVSVSESTAIPSSPDATIETDRRNPGFRVPARWVSRAVVTQVD